MNCIKLTTAALAIGTMFAAFTFTHAAAADSGGTPASKKECADKIACRDYGKKCHPCKKKCMKNCMPCASCGAPMIVVYEMDDFFAVPPPPGKDQPMKPGEAPKAHADHHADKPHKTIVKPVMQKDKNGNPQQIGYLILFTEEIEPGVPAKPAPQAPAKK